MATRMARGADQRSARRAHRIAPEPEPDLRQLALEQGAPLAADVDRLLGDFWPEDEDADEFLATLRYWRQEGG